MSDREPKMIEDADFDTLLTSCRQASRYLHSEAQRKSWSRLEEAADLLDELVRRVEDEDIPFKGAYSTHMPVRDRIGIFDTKIFGGRADDVTCPDGTTYFSGVQLPRYQWELMGSPETIDVIVRAHKETP
jgi:hypothetical protein